MSEKERPAALLTEAQRDYLRGEKDYAPSAERDIRSRIRERVQASMFDLALVANNLPLDDLDKALSEPDWFEPEPGSMLPLGSCMPRLATLLYLYNRDRETQAEGQPDGWATANAVKGGIEAALTRMSVSYESVDVSIEVDRGDDLETLADRDDLSTLSRDQLTQLLRAGLITGDEHAEAWVKKTEQERDEE